jgi:hypothetical protein
VDLISRVAILFLEILKGALQTEMKDDNLNPQKEVKNTAEGI